MPLPAYQLPSSPGVLSVQQPHQSSVASSSSACVLSPLVAHILQNDNPDASTSHSSTVSTKNREFLHSQPHFTSQCPSDCHDKVQSIGRSSEFFCLNKTLSCLCAKVQRGQENIMTKAPNCHKDKAFCSLHTSDSQNSAHISTNQHATVTFYDSSACTTNKNFNSMCHCNSEHILMHATDHFSLHGQGCHCVSNPSHCSDSCMHVNCVSHNPSAVAQNRGLSIQSCNNACSLYSRKVRLPNMARSGLDKEYYPSAFGVHVSMSCTCESHSLSGHEISAASEQQETVRSWQNGWSTKGQEEFVNFCEQHIERNECEIDNDSFPEYTSRDINTGSQYNGQPNEWGKGGDSISDGFEFEAEGPQFRVQERKSNSEENDQFCIKEGHYEEYDFVIIDQESHGPHEARSLNKNKNHEKNATADVDLSKRKKHKKSRRKKIKIKKADLRIPKLTIRISKKEKVCTIIEDDQSRNPDKQGEPEGGNQTNFQQEFLKMLELGDAPQSAQNEEDLSYATRDDWDDLQQSSNLSIHKGLVENPLSDYRGCISETDISIASKSGPHDYQDKGQPLSQDFSQSCILVKDYDDQSMGNDIDGSSFINSHLEKNSIVQDNMNNTLARKGLFERYEEHVQAGITQDGYRDKVIEAYSKFNKRDTILSSIEMSKEQGTVVGDLQLNLPTTHSDESEARRDLTSSEKTPFMNRTVKSRICSFINEGCCDVKLCKRNEDMAFDTNAEKEELFEKASPRCRNEADRQHIDGVANRLCKVGTNEKNSYLNMIKNSVMEETSISSQDEGRQIAKAIKSDVGSCKRRRKRRKKDRYLRNFKDEFTRPHSNIGSNKYKDMKTYRKQRSVKFPIRGVSESSESDENDRAPLESLSLNDDKQNVIYDSNECQETWKPQFNRRNQKDVSDDHASMSEESSEAFHIEPSISGVSEKARAISTKESSSFEKGKSYLIEQILDWASVALSEMASKCSMSLDKSEKTTAPHNDCEKPRESAISLKTPDVKMHKSKRIKKTQRSLSYVSPQKDNDSCRHIQKHVHRHRKKKRHKSDSAKPCKHCRMTQKLSNGDLGIFYTDGEKEGYDREADIDGKNRRAKKKLKRRKCSGKFYKMSCEKKSSIPSDREKEHYQGNVFKSRKRLVHQNAFVEDDNSSCLASPELSGNPKIQPGKEKSPPDVENLKGATLDDDLNGEDEVFEDTKNPVVLGDQPSDKTEKRQLEDKVSKQLPESSLKNVEEVGFDSVMENSGDSQNSIVEVAHRSAAGSKGHVGPEKTFITKGTGPPQNIPISCNEKKKDKECNEPMDLSVGKRNSGMATHNRDDEKSDNIVIDETDDVMKFERRSKIFNLSKKHRSPSENAGPQQEKAAKLLASETETHDDDAVVDLTTHHEKDSKSVETDTASVHSFFKNENCNKLLYTSDWQHTSPENVLGLQDDLIKLRDIASCEGNPSGQQLAEDVQLKSNPIKDNNACPALGQSGGHIFKEAARLETDNEAEKGKADDIQLDFEKNFKSVDSGCYSGNDSIDLPSRGFSKGSIGVCSVDSKVVYRPYRQTQDNCREDSDPPKSLEGPGPKNNLEASEKTSLFLSSVNVTDDEIIEYDGTSKELSNDISVHSFGSLNTGQGFAVVNGRLEQCCILDSSIKAGSGDQAVDGALQHAHTQERVEESPIKSCNSQNTSEPDGCNFKMKQLPFGKSTNLFGSCVKSETSHRPLQTLDCKEKEDHGSLPKLMKEKLSQDSLEEFSIFYQARPQLQRSIYLQAKDQRHKDQFRKLKSLDNPCTSSDGMVKVFQKNHSFSEPRGQPEKSLHMVGQSTPAEKILLKARSWWSANHPPSSRNTASNLASRSHAKHYPFHDHTKPRHSTLNYDKYKYAFPESNNRGLLKRKAYNQPHLHHEQQNFSSVTKKMKRLSPSFLNQISMARDISCSMDVNSVPSFTSASHVEPIGTENGKCPQPVTLNASTSVKYSMACPTYKVPPSLTTLSTNTESSKKFATSCTSPCQPSLTTHNMSQCNTACQFCPSFVTSQACVGYKGKFKDTAGDSGSVRRSTFTTIQLSQNDAQDNFSFNYMKSKSSRDVPSDVKNNINKRHCKKSDRNLNVNSSFINKNKNRSTQKRLSMPDSDKRGPACCEIQALAQKHGPGRSFNKSRYQKANSTDASSCAVTTSHMAASTNCKRRIMPNSSDDFSRDNFTCDTFHGAKLKPNSLFHDHPANTTIKAANNLPLDLSPTTNALMDEAVRTQGEYSLDISLTSNSLGLDMDLISESQESQTTNEHVLDAVMKELKLQIEHLKGEIMQGEALPECGIPGENLLSSSYNPSQPTSFQVGPDGVVQTDNVSPTGGSTDSHQRYPVL